MLFVTPFQICHFWYLILNFSAHIVEKNPTKFKIDNKELTTRKNFIDATRDEVKVKKLLYLTK